MSTVVSLRDKQRRKFKSTVEKVNMTTGILCKYRLHKMHG